MKDIEEERKRDILMKFLDIVGVEIKKIKRININDMVMMRKDGMIEERRKERKGMEMDREELIKKFNGVIKSWKRDNVVILKRKKENIKWVRVVLSLVKYVKDDKKRKCDKKERKNKIMIIIRFGVWIVNG